MFCHAGIDSGEIRALVEIAMPTAEGQILWDRPAVVLAGDDVVDRESKVPKSLGHPAILADKSGATPDLLPQCPRHSFTQRCCAFSV
jgi:hypothetical protein